MIRASDFTWTIVDSEMAEIPLDPAEIYSFDFQWGGTQDRRRSPTQFHPRGRLILNHTAEESVLQRYRELRVEGGGQRFFDVIVNDYETDKGDDHTSLLLESRCTDIGNRDLAWGLQPTPSTPAVPVDQFTVPGVAINTAPMAPLRQILCVAHPDPDGTFYNTRIRRIFRGIESLGHVILLEDVTAPTPTLKALPMPLTAEFDRRPVGKRFSGHTELINAVKFKTGLARHWSADQYKATVQGSAFNRATITFDHIVISDSYNLDFGYYLGVAFPWNRSGRAKVWTSSVHDRFVGFDQIILTEASPNLRPYVAPDGSYAGMASDRDIDYTASGSVSYYYWDDFVSSPVWDIYAKERSQSEKRSIGNTLVAIYRQSDNLQLVRDLIDDWDDWAPIYAQMEFIIENLDAESPVRYQPGDRIGLNFAELSHHAVIIGARWRLRGNRPLRLRWDIVTQEEIPDLTVYLHDLTNPVNRADQPVLLEV